MRRDLVTSILIDAARSYGLTRDAARSCDLIRYARSYDMMLLSLLLLHNSCCPAFVALSLLSKIKSLFV
jgi:hypothetical protein